VYFIVAGIVPVLPVPGVVVVAGVVGVVTGGVLVAGIVTTVAASVFDIAVDVYAPYEPELNIMRMRYL
jgi:hypothetical protein